jgi:cytochrome c-type biogenesis protein CcmH
MTFYPMIIGGTAAAVLGLHLLLLRVSLNGRRPFLALTQRWVEAPAPSSAFALALLTGVAASAFATMPSVIDLPRGEVLISENDQGRFDRDEDLAALKDYAGKLDTRQQSAPPQTKSGSMPGVDQMIEQLAARLKHNPDDVRGWKMLGWSYLNTGRADEAVKVYETALRLMPSDGEIVAGLEAAKAAQTVETDARGTLPPPAHP